MKSATVSRKVCVENVAHWQHTTDVLIVGAGAAGVCAAIEAADCGAEVTVIEAASGAGGTTALSGGQLYLGGGTKTQVECGFSDSLEAMYDYLILASGPNADPEKVRHFVDNNLQHYQWLIDQGMTFKSEFTTEKRTNSANDAGLIYTGNEACYPYDEMIAPAPRGHKGQAPGETGQYFMDILMAAAIRSGVNFVYDARAQAVIADKDGKIVGLNVRIDGTTQAFQARGGTVLCAGGFIMERDMLAKQAPTLARSPTPLGNPYDDGSGIKIGMAAGGTAINMHEGFVSLPFYPPAGFVEGIIVNNRGQRIVAEDSYHGKVGAAILSRPEDRYYLLIDSQQFEALEKPPLGGFSVAGVGETLSELCAEIDVPEANLEQTLAFFNEHASAGNDPLFHKRPPYLKPLDKPPYAAFDISLNSGAYFPVFTFGGLDTRVDGAVLNADGGVVPGLYAAGRNACGLPRCGATYASGMSISDATYFGRMAGAAAAGSRAT